MVSFQDIIFRLQNVGLYDVLMPFFLIFVVVFAVLQKSKILHGKDDKGSGKRFDVVIALIIGLMVVVPHVLGLYPANADVVVIINSALPNVALVLVALLSVFLIVGLFGGHAAWVGKLTGWVALGAFALVLYIFGKAAGWFITTPRWLGWIDNPDTQALLVVFAVFAIIIWFITKEPEEDTGVGKSLGAFGESVGELFGKK